MTAIHRALQCSYEDLRAGLADHVANGWVHEQRHNGLCIYCYTKQTVFERNWNFITEVSRGLIIDHRNQRVVATPFEKFFNVGERDASIPNLPFETFEKLDGSLIIIFYHDGVWQTATKGSFQSDQAMAARDHMEGQTSLTRNLLPGYTYLAEWCSPHNRIVVPYDKSELVLLSYYSTTGVEASYDELKKLSKKIGWRVAKRYSFDSISDLIVHATSLPATEEGFVICFNNGYRLKVKGDEYRRIHALISRCTPLAMWEAMRCGDDLQALRRDLPEEFWTDFDAIIEALSGNLDEVVMRAMEAAESVAHLTDKEVGLRLNEFPDGVRRYIFPIRKHGDIVASRAREMLFRDIRPTGNKLDGYTPSYALNRVLDEAA